MSKHLIFLLGLFGCLIIPACRNLAVDEPMVVTIAGEGDFPEFLAGTWKSEDNDWEFVFEPDGKISSAVIGLGQVRIKPGQTEQIPMKYGGKAVFTPGKWSVFYDTEGKTLSVEIRLEHIYAEFGQDVMEGKSLERFIGTVSEDGKLWYAEWTIFPHYIAHTNQLKNFEITEDPNRGFGYPVTFEKVTEP